MIDPAWYVGCGYSIGALGMACTIYALCKTEVLDLRGKAEISIPMAMFWPLTIVIWSFVPIYEVCKRSFR